jgi:hypothetical protein
MQIVQSPKSVAIYMEDDHAGGGNRTIFMDGRPHAPASLKFYLGDSRGHWEGDTLVVDVQYFTDRTRLDRAGNFHSADLHVVERYTMISPDHIRYEATLDDASVYTRPWKMSFILYRRKEPNVRVLEYECYAYAEEEAVRRGELGPK